MSGRKPTIEQNSQFTAKTKQGQNVEFETTVKFYISPTEQVRITVPGGQQSGPRSGTTTDRGVSPAGRDSGSPGTAGGAAGGAAGGGGRFQGNETIDEAFPRGPECCPKQFVPDPCKAMDNTIRSIKAFFYGSDSGNRGAPPQNVNFCQEQGDAFSEEREEPEKEESEKE